MDAALEARFEGEVLRRIRQHARSSPKTEVCGVLIGREEHGATRVHACIAGAGAEQGGAHVTFTQDAWEHIYRVKDRDYPDDRIVGWYHSHPGFGVFLSDHDTFIHKNFFSAPGQVAWVYDPISDEEGCFGWVGERLERLAAVTVLDSKGGEGAGETGKPEPLIVDTDDDPEPAASHMPAQTARLMDTTITVLLSLTCLVAGALGVWYFFPRYERLFVIVDPVNRQVQTLTESEMKAILDQQSRQLSQPSSPAESGKSSAASASPQVPSAQPQTAPQAGKAKP